MVTTPIGRPRCWAEATIEELSGCRWGARTIIAGQPQAPSRAVCGGRQRVCKCTSSPPLPAGSQCPYFERAVLGTQLLLELGDLAGGVLPQLGEASLQSLHVLHQLGDFPLFGGQLNFEAGAGQHLYGLLLGRRKEMTKLHQLRQVLGLAVLATAAKTGRWEDVDGELMVRHYFLPLLGRIY